LKTAVEYLERAVAEHANDSPSKADVKVASKPYDILKDWIWPRVESDHNWANNPPRDWTTGRDKEERWEG
jgi:hypothetical protein